MRGGDRKLESKGSRSSSKLTVCDDMYKYYTVYIYILTLLFCIFSSRVKHRKCSKPPASYLFFALQRQTAGLHQDKEQLRKMLRSPKECLPSRDQTKTGSSNMTDPSTVGQPDFLSSWPALRPMALCHRKTALPMVAAVASALLDEPKRVAEPSAARVHRCPLAPRSLECQGMSQNQMVPWWTQKICRLNSCGCSSLKNGSFGPVFKFCEDSKVQWDERILPRNQKPLIDWLYIRTYIYIL